MEPRTSGALALASCPASGQSRGSGGHKAGGEGDTGLGGFALGSWDTEKRKQPPSGASRALVFLLWTQGRVRYTRLRSRCQVGALEGSVALAQGQELCFVDYKGVRVTEGTGTERLRSFLLTGKGRWVPSWGLRAVGSFALSSSSPVPLLCPCLASGLWM